MQYAVTVFVTISFLSLLYNTLLTLTELTEAE